MKSIEQTITEREARATARLQALADLQHEFEFLLPDSNDWRPSVRNRGHVAGFEHRGELTILATDGIVGMFVDAIGSVGCYHTAYFDGKIEPLFTPEKKGYSGPRKSAARAAGGKSRSPSAMTTALDELAALLE